MSDQETIHIKEAAAICGVEVADIRALIRSKALISTGPGGNWVYLATVVSALAEAGALTACPLCQASLPHEEEEG